jgi:hypothetical protein
MYTAPNGLNCSRAIRNPASNLNKVRTFLRANGPSTKRVILANVFGVTGPDIRGWNCYMYAAARANGYLKAYRKGRTVLWDVV